ncbi:MAG: collagen-binding domain-containing protein [Pseudomonadota bacterium]
MRFALTACCLTLATSASAAPLSLDEVLGVFNGVGQNFATTSDVEGRLYVEGDLNSSFTTFINPNVPNPPDYDALIVGGDITGGTINLNNGGNAQVGGANNGNVNLNGGGSITTNVGTVVPEIDFDALKATSTFLSQLSGGAPGGDMNNRIFSLSPNADPLEANFGPNTTIVNTDFSILGNGGYTIDLNNPLGGGGPIETLIINVAGNGGPFGLNALGGTKSASPNVIWNFYEAQGTISVNSTLFGHVLAPMATITNFGSASEGTVIAMNINVSGELHQQPFDGVVPTPPVVPLPAGLPLLAGALAGFAVLRRMRSG